ncbi:Oxysterol-binding protein-related protein 9 [Eumeta japonica]|uniref:Oxysterol-binding protein n=1 Tax=Eumeta variegata TaxID=151549 RepID=A0A4C1XHM3_EUMVA|nr:Oxysterol-binding protein-related protein 9 [Eumeta japonica]
MYSRELASARQVEPVNQALGIDYGSRGAPQDVNSLTGIEKVKRKTSRMYSRELASARQVEPVNQALGTVIFSGVYHKGACPLPCKDEPTGCKLTHRIDSGSRSPMGCKLTHRNRFWLERAPQDQEVGDGPVPWCSPDQLSFVAEQVSHHPPISAFYAEHVNKRIQFEAWVWTKSKFLGLSIGVHNIGKGVVTLLDTGEEYSLTFPNGYGRSILTVPWIELGGPVAIECPQTGHRANIEFVTKPFYGGKKHRVTCEVFAGTERKPYYTAHGEWNSKMEGRWTDTGRTETLFEVSCMKPRRKRVAPVSKQNMRESRRVWRHVTCALRAGDCDAATAAKRRVEQAQRDAARQRELDGEKWVTQLFSPKNEEAWEYKCPLRKRLEGIKHSPQQRTSESSADSAR